MKVILRSVYNTAMSYTSMIRLPILLLLRKCVVFFIIVLAGRRNISYPKNVLSNGHVVRFNLNDYVYVNNADHNGLCENENVITFYSGINIYALLKGIFYNKFLKYDKYKT